MIREKRDLHRCNHIIVEFIWGHNMCHSVGTGLQSPHSTTGASCSQISDPGSVSLDSLSWKGTWDWWLKTFSDFTFRLTSVCVQAVRTNPSLQQKLLTSVPFLSRVKEAPTPIMELEPHYYSVPLHQSDKHLHSGIWSFLLPGNANITYSCKQRQDKFAYVQVHTHAHSWLFCLIKVGYELTAGSDRHVGPGTMCFCVCFEEYFNLFIDHSSN